MAQRAVDVRMQELADHWPQADTEPISRLAELATAIEALTESYIALVAANQTARQQELRALGVLGNDISS